MTDRQPVPSGNSSSADRRSADRHLADRHFADRRSACPGLFRLAPALDGAICRVKLAGGRLTADQAKAVALAAGRFSPASVELTNRANFQIRAVQAADEMPLIEALIAAGLGPRRSEDASAACAIDDPAMLGSDDVRNVMVSPLAGRDPRQNVDILPLADRFLESLQREPRYHALSPKFAIQIDGGESVAMLRHPHDIWLSAGSPSEVMIGLGGCMPAAGDETAPAGDRALAAAPIDAAHDLVCAMLDLFLEIAAEFGIARMKQMPAELAGAAFINRLRQRTGIALRQDADVAMWRRRPSASYAHLGLIAEREPGSVSVGAMPPLGRIASSQLAAIAGLAARHGDGSLRLTPWQSVILPAVAAPAGAAVLRELTELGLAGDEAMPFAQMIACAGSAGCGSGLAATQADGAALAHLLRARGKAFPVHLSGCGKSCAAMRAEPATLVAVSGGHYDLYCREVGATSRFGRLAATNITLEEAADVLADLADRGMARP